MAGLEDGLQKYQKVYNFLKRTLAQDKYEGIRVIEPCVIVADGFNKKFQFAVLGAEMLYIIDNPPKVAKGIRMTVDLATITAVKMIHDIAEFLGGDLKNRVQHIHVTFKKRPVIPQPIGDYSPNTALKSSLLTASALFQRDDNNRSSTFSRRGSSGAPDQHSTQLIPSNHLAVQASQLKLSASEGNIRQMLEEERLQLPSEGPFSRGLLPVCGRPLPVPPSNRKETPSRRRQKKNRRNQEQESDTFDSSSSSNDLELSFRSISPQMDLHPLEPYERFRVPSPDPRSWRTRKHHRTSSNESSEGVADREFSANTGHDSSGGNIDEMDIYILEKQSPMFPFLKSSWNNCILKSTLQSGKEISSSSSAKRFSIIDNSELLTLFNQLKTEILQSHHMEKNFVLINELLTAAQKSFSLKKLFWKSPELFNFIVDQIKMYLPESPSTRSRQRGNNRADEFDYIVVLLETLVCMFRETEILQSRLNVLKAHKGQTLRDLLEHVIATPCVGRKSSESKISPAAQLLLYGPNGDVRQAAEEDETAKLLNEVLDCVTSVIYEILTAVHQSSVFKIENNTINISWLIKIIDTHREAEAFVKRMMDRQMSVVLSDRKPLSTKSAVLVYRQLYILHNLLEYSHPMASAIPRSYSEEFRYYIKRHIEKKLPIQFPLTMPTLSLLSHVSDAILKTKASFR
ncbi:uncharacterized protein C12orf56 [Nematostella vectensis]|nr:uncharacterized protein C12orf56 [Nematostella vectensis]